jgi:3-methyladenine DNA glycosylase AlkD
MEYKEIIAELRNLGDARAVKVWERMGMNTSNYLGVNLTKLKELSKQAGKDHDLARRLWNSGIHDAMLMATMVEDPKAVTEEQIDAWILDIDFLDLCDKFCSNVVVKTSFAYKKMKRWLRSEEEYVCRAGYILLTLLAKKDEWLEDHEYINFLDNIERSIHSRQNWVREAMNYALISIGSRNKVLNDAAHRVAVSIGNIDVDYGESSCRVPDAREKLMDRKLHEKLNLKPTG